MKASGRRLLTLAFFLVTLILVWVVSMLLHEVWHGLAAEALGGDLVWVRIKPGIEVWPAFGRVAADPWGTGFTRGPGWAETGWQGEVVGVMGSIGNLLLAGLALGALWLFRPRGVLRLLLMAQALMFADLLLYCTLPEFFGLPHYFVLGGNFPEPLEAAVALGCPRWAFILGVVIVSGLMAWGVVAADGSSKAQIATGGLGHWSPVAEVPLLQEEK
jgi:hypothetical protein